MRRVVLLLVSAFSVGVVWTGCTSSDDDDDTSPTPIPPPSFQGDVVPIFYSQCGAESGACHSRVTFVANSAAGCTGFLALENTALGSVFYAGSNQGASTGCPDESLHARVLKAAFQCTDGRPYVAPGDHTGSYLFNKIGGGPYCLLTNGELSAPMPFDSPIDDPSDIERIVEWILDGAPNN